jgi:F0F1-type ATP synthase membrane subunit a
VHDSKHISILGIDFKKSLFLTIATAILVFLVLLIIFIVGKMKVMNTVAKEKTVIADLITHEFEEYKRKALEKQTKLARELQNERNKIQELRGS